MTRYLAYLVFTLLIVFGWKKDEDDKGAFHNPLLASQLRLSSDTLSLNENTFVLNTYVYRDFMPIAEENGNPMISGCILSDVNSIPFLFPVTMKKQYVINGELVWSVDFERTTETSDYSMEGVSWGGPKWGPHINVDLVCEFAYQGTTYRIIARDQEIERTD